MDWAEELKMSIKKTTARKGRRSKSRDILKEKTTKNSSISSSSNSQGANKTKEISIDITLDLQQNTDSVPTTSSAATTHKPLSFPENESKPPPVRRISGGWADSSLNVLKSSKSKRVSYDDDRFQHAKINSAASSPLDDIPVIPDLDDIKDDINSNELESPSLPMKHESPGKYNEDLLSQNAFKAIGVDLTILTRSLHPPEYLDEADTVWEWDKVFIDVVAEINSNKAGTNSPQKIKIGPDEVPPAM